MRYLEFKDLPQMLKVGLEGITDPKAQNLFVFASMSVISAMSMNVWGKYDNRVVYPNLYLLVIAPAASGKGSMTDALKYMVEVHKKFVERSKSEQQRTKRASTADEKERKRQPVPPYKAPIIAGNISSAMLIQQLTDNGIDTPSIIFETEIDSLAFASASEWGQLSPLLRTAFHNETTRYARKTDNTRIDLELPKLAVCLSGTSNQLNNLIRSAEDGLYSRFMVLEFDEVDPWRDVSPCDSCVDRAAILEKLSTIGFQFSKFQSEQEIEVRLSKAQWAHLNGFGVNRLAEESDESAAGACVKRHALMLFKLCMVLSAMRAFESGKTGEIVCSESDFQTALSMAEYSLEGSLSVLSNLPQPNSQQRRKEDAFFNRLPIEFSTAEAIKAGKAEKISTRTVERYLARLESRSRLDRLEHGRYKKVTDQSSQERA